MITAKVKMNLDFPIINAIEPLEQIAKKVIIPDIVGRMNTGKDVSGGTYQGLARSTMDMKQKRGQQSKPLHATGQLRSSFKSKREGGTSVRITPDGMRKSYFKEKAISNAELGDILQNQGVRTKFGKRFFEFFGISKESEIEAMRYMNQYIKRAITRGGRKIVR